MGLYYKTKSGKFYLGDSKESINKDLLKKYKGQIQLIITSPPFPLNKKKRYGNLQGEEYKIWLKEFAPFFSELLTDDGSIVMEIGNAWNSGSPTQSFLHLESLLEFVKHPLADLKLCQEFVCYNPSKLPSPAQWVTINRIRVVDSYTHVWWMSKTDFPKADNRKVLRPYSTSMQKLLKNKKYNFGKRPSEHNISERGFLKENGGSIMHNLIELESLDSKKQLRLPQNVLSFSNTDSQNSFMEKCKKSGIKPHPARMAMGLISFFVEFLTDPGDLVFDPFAGSNTTGFVAEILGRNWICSEISEEYAKQSKLRFFDNI